MVINMERHDTAPRAANTNMRSLQSTNGGIDRLLLCTTVLLDREGTDRWRRCQRADHAVPGRGTYVPRIWKTLHTQPAMHKWSVQETCGTFQFVRSANDCALDLICLQRVCMPRQDQTRSTSIDLWIVRPPVKQERWRRFHVQMLRSVRSSCVPLFPVRA
jgi:hypothetical protein